MGERESRGDRNGGMLDIGKRDKFKHPTSPLSSSSSQCCFTTHLIRLASGGEGGESVVGDVERTGAVGRDEEWDSMMLNNIHRC
jgi:hypothetical protein